MFDDDVHVNLQNCQFIPWHLGHNQLPFVYMSPRGPLFWPPSSPACWVTPYENWINHHSTWQFFSFYSIHVRISANFIFLSLSSSLFLFLRPFLFLFVRSFFTSTLLPLFPLFESFRSFTPIGGYRINKGLNARI